MEKIKKIIIYILINRNIQKQLLHKFLEIKNLF